MRRDLLPFQIVIGVTSAGIGGIITVMGEVRDELGLTDAGIGIIVATGFLAAFVAQISLAQYADRGHAREMVVVGVALSAVAPSRSACRPIEDSSIRVGGGAPSTCSAAAGSRARFCWSGATLR